MFIYGFFIFIKGMNQQFKTRIAPTPSGFLHIGNGVNFLITSYIAKIFGCSILLRIDDIDAQRCKDEYLQDIFNVIEWLEIPIDEGPSDIRDFKLNWSQHLRLNNYKKLFNELKTKSCEIIPCACSRKMKLENTCRCYEKQVEKPYNMVFHTLSSKEVVLQDHFNGKSAFDLKNNNGIVLSDKFEMPSYQICSLSDDIYFGISHIVRGIDLLPSSFLQLYLSQLVSNSLFEQCRFYHHSLLLNKNEIKLSKSAGDASLKHMIEKGFTRKALIKKIPEMLNLKDVKYCEDQALIDAIRLKVVK